MDATSALAHPPDFLKLIAHDLRWKLVTALSRSDHRVHELVRLLDQPMNLVSYHLKQLRDQQLVTERRSSADGRDVYYSLDLDALRVRYFATGEALHPALTTTDTPNLASAAEDAHHPTRVLFLCTHNSARSQMAEGILRHLSRGQVDVFSAGGDPSDVHPAAVAALANIGIDIRQQYAKHLDRFRGHSFDYIVTVCDRMREACPTFPEDPVRIHWSIPDPAAVEGDEMQNRAFAHTAQELVTRIRFLLTVIRREQGKGK
jgi:protein-tyrosine-phosphatase